MASSFNIGTFLISPDLNRIEDTGVSGSSVQIEPKVMDVLVCLQNEAGTVVSRERILAEVWGDAVVGEDVLTRAVGRVRRILGDDPRNPQFIETIPSRGYILRSIEAIPSDTSLVLPQ